GGLLYNCHQLRLNIFPSDGDGLCWYSEAQVLEPTSIFLISAHSLSYPSSGHSASPSSRWSKSSSSSAIAGSLILSQSCGLRSSNRPTKSSSCHLVIITITLPPL